MNTVTFDCQLERCLFQKDGYYIYAMKIDRFKYPDIEAENRDFVSFDKGSSLVIRINNKIKKEKKNSFSKILSKIKKGK
jgi:hypothetical protein